MYFDHIQPFLPFPQILFYKSPPTSTSSTPSSSFTHWDLRLGAACMWIAEGLSTGAWATYQWLHPNSPFPRSLQLPLGPQVGLRVCEPLLHPCWNTKWLDLAHSCCEWMQWHGMHRSLPFTQCSSPSFVSYILSVLSFLMFSWPWVYMMI